jgi:hypothetical protein
MAPPFEAHHALKVSPMSPVHVLPMSPVYTVGERAWVRGTFEATTPHLRRLYKVAQLGNEDFLAA